MNLHYEILDILTFYNEADFHVYRGAKKVIYFLLDALNRS